jgi:arginase family enzyme
MRARGMLARTLHEAMNLHDLLPGELLAATFVTVAGLEIERHGDAVVVRNPVLGSHREVAPSFLRVLAHFEQPRLLGSAAAVEGVAAEDVVAAVSCAFLLDVDLLVTPAKPALGLARSMSALLTEAAFDGQVIFGAPIDAAAGGRGGARMGPHEIRAVARLPFLDPAASAVGNPFQPAGGPEEPVFLDFELRRRYVGQAPRVMDVGDIKTMGGEGIRTFGARVGQLASWILDRGGRPGMLGGDHSITWFVLQQVLARRPAIGIIHFDAHHDLWPPLGAQFDYVTHAMPLFHALAHPGVQVLLQLGLRTFEDAMPSQLHRDDRVRYVSARELQTRSPAQVFEGLPRELPYYLSFDIDCMDPAVAPETGTPVPGGLSYYQALDLVDYAARTFTLVGWDVVEVSQREQQRNQAALVAAALVRQLLLGAMAFEPLDGYRRTP